MLSEAEKKFWGTPKLMENLLPFLDTYSITCLVQVNTSLQILDYNLTISLAQAYKAALGVILDKAVWNNLIKRVCNWKRTLKPPNQEKEFQQMRIQVTCIVKESFLNVYLYKDDGRFIFLKEQNVKRHS